jgi:diacylglycerol kinase (ATP)
MNGKVTVIFNPASAGGKTAGRFKAISAMIRSQLSAKAEILLTGHVHQATVLARQVLKTGSALLIGVGGDGTIQEIVNGYFENNRPLNSTCRLRIINCGTGSGLAQSLAIPENL